ncbi:MAG: biotin/lipoyl-binding protein [SAR324 cluster bacterium]|nr:biotin/lipoyl-binding protein [SAR324 cluster bacterium]
MRKYEFSINDKPYTVTVKDFSTEAAEVEINNKSYSVKIRDVITERGTAAPKPHRSLTRNTAPVAPATAPGGGGGQGSVTAPIPGAIIAIMVKSGDEVKMGQPLFKMEAMKMENEINSRVNGIVQTVQISVGDTVSQGQELITIAVTEDRRRG